MKVKQGLICTLVVCLGANLVPARVRADETRPPAEAVAGEAAAVAIVETAAAAPAFDVETAVRHAVASLEIPAVPPAELTPSAPSPARATTAAAALKKQGGSAGMIIGLVSLVAGLAMTYYMVKQMNDNNDSADQ